MGFLIVQNHLRIKKPCKNTGLQKVGNRGGSNPRPSESQSDALTN